jgi:hypothetical protein
MKLHSNYRVDFWVLDVHLEAELGLDMNVCVGIN